jgi:outer membrane protein OmpA-like peptidoglycan-associated protein
MKKHIFTFWLFTVFSAQAQQADIWYFGNKVGVDFRQEKPVVLTDGELVTWEGVASVCDKKGNLLFYTDGTTIYNAKHKVMPNGKNLHGNTSATQSAIIIPKIGFPTQYYIFTIAELAKPKGFCYSVVDMSLDKGLGDVIPQNKNIQLHTLVTEKLTAIKHQNGKDVWVIVHEWKSNKFLTFLITEKGVNTTPIISEIGSAHLPLKTDIYGPLNTQGYMKSNPDGINLAVALQGDGIIELFDFDNKTGKVSKPISIELPKKLQPYGIEFSPNGSLLYVALIGFSGKIYQYNLQKSSDSIPKTQMEIGNFSKKSRFGALQLAPDKKIYISQEDQNFLGVIHNPNNLGLSCQYEADYLKLNAKAGLGLPNFIPNLFEPQLTSTINYFDKNAVKIGEKMVLKNVQFDYNLAQLKPSNLVDLNDLADYMQKHPQTYLKLSGHTDNIGNKPTNLVLSQNRVKAVKDYLVGKQIGESRISFEGYGSSAPLFTNDSEENRAKNRRVEIEILEKK